MVLEAENLRLLLEEQGWQPTADGPYFRCRQGWDQAGWRLHVAVTRSHFAQLLKDVIPLLGKIGASICIFRDCWLGEVIVNGGFGIGLQGKVLTILPEDGQQACEIAGLLASATGAMRGPDVPGAYHLGGRVYAEYIRDGGLCRFEPDTGSKGLLRFFQDFEFVLPRGVSWPFDKVAGYRPPKKRFLLQGRYLFVDMLKTDAKGHVIQALRLRWGLPISCVIKEGLAGIGEDDAGRDATDRIRWQAHIAGRVKGHIRTAEVLAYFKVGRKAYLVTRWVPSTGLSTIFEQILAGRSWPNLKEAERIRIKQYLTKVLYILVGLHELGIIHCDVTPFNFRVDARDLVWVLDLEQCFDRQRNQPTPPFSGGTPGYKSEQEVPGGLPGPDEDVFGFGGLMIFAATGFYPHHFMGLGDKRRAYAFLTGDGFLADLLAKCRLSNPTGRPSTDDLIEAIKHLPTKDVSGVTGQKYLLTEEELRDIVKEALSGLHHPAMRNADGYWKSVDRNQKNHYSGQWSTEIVSPGLYDGVGGVLLTIFKAIGRGIKWNLVPAELNKNISYLLEQMTLDQKYGPGLWHGTAGLQMVIAEGIKTGIFQGHEQQMLNILGDGNLGLDISHETDLSYGSGLAGITIGLLSVRGYQRRDAAAKAVLRICELQLPNGGWKGMDNSFSEGSAGIIWSLLVYLQHAPGDSRTALAARNALSRLTKEILKGNGRLQNIANPWLDGSAGLALCYLKAFQVLGERAYLDTATQILNEYPERIASNMLTAGGGLAGVGEAYLYAWQVTGNSCWRQRADWIAQLFGHLFYRPQEGIGWWTTDRPIEPSPSLFTGGGGPLYFLLDYLHAGREGCLIPGA